MTTDPIGKIEAALELSDDELAEKLPDVLDELEGQTEQLMLEQPALFARVTQRMDAIDVGTLANEQPETVEQFQALLWTGMELLVRASPDVQSSITDDISVNFQADDAPMTGHLELDGSSQTITGGTDLLAEPDLSITGPADELVGIITGSTDPIQGFMQQRYQLEGPIQKGTQLAGTMGQLTALLPDDD
ncbi:SCP2 sterol-binding domain-containing protein [Halocatena halophila]|uniref:SCP2 sterol-binding domain-containing protein n=1 Tax=Halocatena halophila TaxID=2814576 RepID=UPI002ED20453